MSMRKIVVEGQGWQWAVGKRFVTFLSPNDKRTNVPKPVIAMYGLSIDELIDHDELYEVWRCNLHSGTATEDDEPVLPITPKKIASYIKEQIIRCDHKGE